MHKSVRGEQITELVVNFRLRHGHPGQQRKTRKNRDAANRGQGGFLISRNPGEPLLDSRKYKFAEPGHRQNQSEADCENNPV